MKSNLPGAPFGDTRQGHLRMPGRWATLMGLVAAAVVLLAILAARGEAATAPPLGTAQNFAVLAGAGITNTGPTTISGDVGSFPTTTQTGFDSVTLSGANHGGDAVTQGAKNDLVTAYNNAAGQTPVTTIATELGGAILLPGTYDSSAGTFGITGTVTLDAQNDPNAVFIFQMESTLITASSSSVSLIGNAQACNVFWQVGSSATLGTNSSFVGNILASESISLTTGATVNGRVLASGGAVTMDTNTITATDCIVAATSTPVPSDTNTPVPEATATEIAAATATQVAAATATQVAAATATQEAAATAEAEATQISPAAATTQALVSATAQAILATATQAAASTATQAAAATATKAAAGTATQVPEVTGSSSGTPEETARPPQAPVDLVQPPSAGNGGLLGQDVSERSTWLALGTVLILIAGTLILVLSARGRI